MNRIVWQWPAAVLYSVVFVTLAALVWQKVFHPEVLLTMLAWLIPAPYRPKQEPIEIVASTSEIH